ncbi:MAG: hypothetical protein QM523_07310 [Candidatus Pacebacteria bacterium]|nr:hypothetical protein [Candidatus Paceibacterota bacterium]
MKKLNNTTAIAIAAIGLLASTLTMAAAIAPSGLGNSSVIDSSAVQPVAAEMMAGDSDKMMEMKMKESRDMMKDIKPGKDDKSLSMMMQAMRMMMNDMDTAIKGGKITEEDRAMMTEMLDSMKVMMHNSSMMMKRNVWHSSPK